MTKGASARKLDLDTQISFTVTVAAYTSQLESIMKKAIQQMMLDKFHNNQHLLFSKPFKTKSVIFLS